MLIKQKDSGYEVIMEGNYDNEFADCVWCKKGNYRLIISDFPPHSHPVDFTFRSVGIEQLGTLTNDIVIKEFLFTEAYNDSFYISKLFQFELTVNKTIKIQIELNREDYEGTKNFDDLQDFRIKPISNPVNLENPLIMVGIGGYYLMVIGRFEFVTIPGQKATFYPFRVWMLRVLLWEVQRMVLSFPMVVSLAPLILKGHPS